MILRMVVYPAISQCLETKVGTSRLALLHQVVTAFAQEASHTINLPVSVSPKALPRDPLVSITGSVQSLVMIT